VTIDATAISADEWLSVETVPVLTAPSKPVGVKWDIVTAPGAPKRRAYWVTEGETSTMYLGKHVAMRVILR
jgi:hypothetical protein